MNQVTFVSVAIQAEIASSRDTEGNLCTTTKLCRDYGHSSSRDDYPSRGYRYVTLLLLPWLDVKKFFSCKNYCFGAYIFLFNIVIEMAMVVINLTIQITSKWRFLQRFI